MRGNMNVAAKNVFFVGQITEEIGSD